MSGSIRVLFYCVGSGIGHLLRSTAIARKLQKIVSGNIAVLTDSSLCYILEQEEVDYIFLRDLDGSEDSCAMIREVIGRISPELFVTDSYPLGLCGELAPVLSGRGFKKVFLRQNREHGLSCEAGGAEQLKSVMEHYDLVIDLEPLSPLGHRAELSCFPVLIRDCWELHSHSMAKKLLLSDTDRKVVLVVTRGGRKNMLSFLNGVKDVFMRVDTHDFDLRFASAYNVFDSDGLWQHVKYFPLFGLFRGVDLLVGMGDPGYGLFYESVQTGIPTVFAGKPAGVNYKYASNQIAVAGDLRSLEKGISEGLDAARAFGGAEEEFYNASEEAAIHMAKLLFSEGSPSAQEYTDNFRNFLF